MTTAASPGPGDLVSDASAKAQPTGFDFVVIGSGLARIGSDLDEVKRCVDYWSCRLVDPSYRPHFENWIMKEWPAHSLLLPSYRIGRFPVTNADYAAFVTAKADAPPPSILLDEPPDHPVWGVTLEQACAFARWAADRLNMQLRLPTEFEWEFAARGPEGLEYPFGATFDPQRCNTIEARIGRTTPVDHYRDFPSPLGVCDLAGNVEEWTSSRYRVYPGGCFVSDDLVRGGIPDYPVLKGGCFALGGDLARNARRHGPHAGERFRYRGFRLAGSEAV